MLFAHYNLARLDAQRSCSVILCGGVVHRDKQLGAGRCGEMFDLNTGVVVRSSVSVKGLKGDCTASGGQSKVESSREYCYSFTRE